MVLIFTYFDFSQSLLYILFCFENSLTVLLHSLSILFYLKYDLGSNSLKTLMKKYVHFIQTKLNRVGENCYLILGLRKVSSASPGQVDHLAGQVP